MEHVDQEIVTQQRVIDWLHRELGYRYLGDLRHEENTPVISLSSSSSNERHLRPRCISAISASLLLIPSSGNVNRPLSLPSIRHSIQKMVSETGRTFSQDYSSSVSRLSMPSASSTMRSASIRNWSGFLRLPTSSMHWISIHVSYSLSRIRPTSCASQR